jgi:putative membrane protein
MLANEAAVILSVYNFFLSLLTVQGPYDWGWRMHTMWGWGWGIGMMAMMLLFWGVMIFAGVAGIRWFIIQGKLPRADRALEILRERFARGEIDKDEFETKKRELS